MSKISLPAFDVRAFEYYLKNRMKGDPTFKDYDFEGSGLSSIIRILALDSNNAAFIGNMLFGEGFLLSAQQRSNVGLNAQFLSYTPDNYQAAYGYYNIKVTPYDASTAPAQIILDRKAMFIGVKDNKSYNFCVDTPIAANLDATTGSYLFENVKLIQGTWAYKTYTVEGTAISTYKIPSDSVDINHMVVQVQADSTSDVFATYDRYESPYNLDKYAQLYFVELGIDGSYTIEFGDGFISKRLEDGNVIYLQYLNTEGAAGNDITNITSASSIGGFNLVDITAVSERTAGGADPESIDDTKRLAPLAYQAAGAAVAESDYAVLTERLFSNVLRARSYGGDKVDPPAPGYTYIAVIPTVGEKLSDAEKAEIEAALDKYNVGSITPKVVDTEVIYIDVSTLVRWDPTTTSLDEDQLKTQVATKVQNWGDQNLDNFAEIFDRGILQDAITKFDRSIVSNITNVKYKRHFEPTPGIVSSFVFNYRRSIKAGTVYLYGFKPLPAEVDYTYDIRDVNGVLNLYKTSTTDTTSRFLVQSVGTVDYTNGVVNLKSLTVSKYDDGGATIIVAPDGDDQGFTAVGNEVMRIGGVTVQAEIRYVQRT